MQINTLPFTYQPGYYPDISLLIGDVVKGWYGWRNDYQTNIEKGHVVKHGVESGVVFGVEFGVIVGVNLESFLESILSSILPIYSNTKQTQQSSNELKENSRLTSVLT